MGKLAERIKYWSQILLLPVYGISFLIPRNKRIWLFGSTFGNRFAENPRYFYLYVNQYKSTEITAIWISKNREVIDFLAKSGYKAYLKNSLKGFWYCLRGGIYLYDNYPKDISHFLSGGAVKINLWHGLPLKKIQMDNKLDFIRNPRNWKEKLIAFPRRLSDEKPSHYVLTTSTFFKPIFSSAFGTRKVIICGYPRCDIFTTDQIRNIYTSIEVDSMEKIMLGKEKNQKIILYMPTFRDSEIKFFDTVCLKELQLYLMENNYLLCVKLHCKSKLNERFIELESSNIHIISSEADPYCYIGSSDLLITDYSSIYFDYLLSGKPILFFYYDYEEYISHSRELYFSYEEFTPGEKVQSMEALQLSITAILEGREEAVYARKREMLKSRVFDDSNTLGAEELYRILMKKEV